ncbi:MAG: NCS2 family permease [Angelakisella sp.]
MEKLFKLKAHGTDVKTEIMAGITTFFAMAYIIFVNANYLSLTGMDYTGVMVATCVSAAVGCLLTAFLANVPFCQAPGMGLNTFFTFTVCFGMGYTWEQALAIVFISGLLFLVITVTPLRSKIIASIPAALKAAISAGIGFFIALIGMFNVNIVTAFGSGAAGSYTDMGSITKGAALLALIGLIITAVLVAYRVKGAIFIGIIVTTIIGIFMGETHLPDTLTVAGIGEAFSSVAFKLDFAGAFTAGGIVPFLTAVITFAICDCFDTVGTLLGTAGNAGMLDENGNFPGGDRALIADAIATCTGALIGTSTVTTFVESSTGIEDGGRTGLTSLTTGILFLLAIVLAPVAGIVPSAATAPALIIVGVFMMKGVLKVDWSDMETAIPCFLTIAMMPFAYSIADGIGFGIISYTLIKLARGKAKEVPVLMYILSALFILSYILLATTAA